MHDILVTLGIYSISGFQVSPDTVIAFLTVLGYSLYDTIVVFDKVQENTRGLASTNRLTYSDTVNLSMNQVLARSINTSLVAILPILSILVIGAWVLGATALQDFGLALFVGLTTGAYSSIFIASPLLALLKEREPRYAEIRRRLAVDPHRPVPAHHPGRGGHGRPERDGRGGGGAGVAGRIGPAGAGGRARRARGRRAGPTRRAGDGPATRRTRRRRESDNGAAGPPRRRRPTAPAPASLGAGSRRRPAPAPAAGQRLDRATGRAGRPPSTGQPAAAPAPEEAAGRR